MTIVFDFGTEIQVLTVPGDVIARGQIFFGRGLVPMVGETVDLRVIPGRMGETGYIPEAVVERIPLPVRQISVYRGGAPIEERESDTDTDPFLR